MVGRTGNLNFISVSHGWSVRLCCLCALSGACCTPRRRMYKGPMAAAAPAMTRPSRRLLCISPHGRARKVRLHCGGRRHCRPRGCAQVSGATRPGPAQGLPSLTPRATRCPDWPSTAPTTASSSSRRDHGECGWQRASWRQARALNSSALPRHESIVMSTMAMGWEG